MIHSPAHILSQYLIDMPSSIVCDPARYQAGLDKWPCFTAAQTDKPDNQIVIYNTMGVPRGRVQRGGQTKITPTISVRIRAQTDPEGWDFGSRLVAVFDAILRAPVVVEENDYTIHAVSVRGSLLPLGQETGNNRMLFTLNAFITFVE